MFLYNDYCAEKHFVLGNNRDTRCLSATFFSEFDKLPAIHTLHTFWPNRRWSLRLFYAP